MKTPLISPASSDVITALRFPMALLVVFVHASLASLPAVNSADMPVTFYTSYFLSDIVANIGVPFFFLISGYLFFLGVEQYGVVDYKRKLGKRVQSLLKPYLAWNVVYLAFVAACQLFAPQLMNGSNKQVAEYGWLDWIMSFVSMDYVNDGFSFRTFDVGPIDQPLWYVRDLMLLALFSPLVYWCVKKLKWVFLLVVALLWGSDVCRHILCIHSIGVLFFSAGAYLSLFKLDLVELVKPIGRYAVALFLIVAAVIVVLQPEDMVLKNVSFALGVVAVIYLAHLFLEKTNYQPNKLLADSSFFLYASHYYVVIGAIRIVVNKLSGHDVLATLAYIVTPLAVSAAIVLVYKAMKSFMPSLLKVFTGGR